MEVILNIGKIIKTSFHEMKTKYKINEIINKSSKEKKPLIGKGYTYA